MARRYDVATGASTQTALPSDITGQAEWAADSRRYLVLEKGRGWAGGVEPGALRYVEPDGSLGETNDVAGGLVAGYAPGGGYLLLDCSTLMSQRPVPSKVVDLSTGKVLREFAERPLGWADAARYVVLADRTLQLVEVTTGTVAATIPLGPPVPASAVEGMAMATVTIYTAK